MCTSRVFRNGLQQMTLLKYFNHIEPSKEERIQSALPKPDGPLVRLIPCSTLNRKYANFYRCRALSMKPDSPNAKRLFIAIFYIAVYYYMQSSYTVN